MENGRVGRQMERSGRDERGHMGNPRKIMRERAADRKRETAALSSADLRNGREEERLRETRAKSTISHSIDSVCV